MSAIDNLEKNYLFRLTRFVALFFIAIAIVPIILGAVHFTQSLFPESIAISETEISEIIKPTVYSPDKGERHESPSYSAYNKIGDPLSGLKLPFSVQKYFSTSENMETLRNWVRPMSHVEREQFLKEIETVVKKAEAQNLRYLLKMGMK